MIFVYLDELLQRFKRRAVLTADKLYLGDTEI